MTQYYMPKRESRLYQTKVITAVRLSPTRILIAITIASAIIGLASGIIVG